MTLVRREAVKVFLTQGPHGARKKRFAHGFRRDRRAFRVLWFLAFVVFRSPAPLR